MAIDLSFIVVIVLALILISVIRAVLPLRPVHGITANPTAARRTFGIFRAMDNTTTQSALDALRTAEFRLSLRGYDVDEVDDFLERAAVEADQLREQVRQTASGHPGGRAGSAPRVDRSRTGRRPPTATAPAADAATKAVAAGASRRAP